MAAAALLGVGRSAVAADYPERPIKIDVMYAAGAATDFQARIVTSRMQKVMGQPGVIVNMPGAGGMSGWNEFVSKAKPDGYELASYNAPSFIAQSIQFKDRAKFNLDNLVPIANWGVDPAVLIVPASSPFSTVDELVEYARANPKALTISGAGLFAGHDIARRQLENAAGIQTSYVATAGGGPAMQMVVSAHAKAGFNNLSDAYRNRSRLKILAIAMEARDEKFLPEVPTLMESGFDVDGTSANHRGLMGVKDTPADIIGYLEEKLIEIFKSKEVGEKMEKGGSPMKIMGAGEVAQMWQDQHKTLVALFKDVAS